MGEDAVHKARLGSASDLTWSSLHRTKGFLHIARPSIKGIDNENISMIRKSAQNISQNNSILSSNPTLACELSLFRVR